MTDTEWPDLGERISELWSAERCTWKAEYEDCISRSDSAGWWHVWLEWTSEHGNPHQADWVQYTWQFTADTIAEALDDALAWLEELAPLAPCRECDGLGAWQGKTCADCNGSGLAETSEGGHVDGD